MAIKGKISLSGGVEVDNVYVKISTPVIVEKVVSETKIFSIEYRYEYKKDSTSEKFFSGFDAVTQNVNIDGNLFNQCYNHLAAKLNISNVQV